MSILIALKNGAFRLAKIWKNVLVIWFVMLLLVTAFVSPLKGILDAGLGSSLITEKFSDGIYLEGLLDSGNFFESVLSGLTSGFFTLLIISFLLNAFFTGGLFHILRYDSAEYSVKDFMKACAVNFGSFLLILIVTSIFIFFSMLLITAIPFMFIDSEGSNMDLSIFRASVASFIIYALLMPVMLLISDYSRAWKAVNSNAGIWKAIGKGFSLTFSAFFRSWGLMIILMILNFSYLILIMALLPGLTPDSGWGVFFLFLISQFIYLIRLLLKSYRYSCVSSLMEMMTGREIAPQI
jgi:hypothetical protein